MSRHLAEVLLKDKVITGVQFTEASEAAKSGKSYVRYLIEKKYIAETKLLYYLSQKFGLPSVNISKFDISPDVLKKIPPDLAKKNQVIPLQANQGTFVVALCDPSNMQMLESLKFILKMNVEAVLTSYSAFDAAMTKYYSGTAFVGAAIESYQKDRKAPDESAVSEGANIVDIDSSSNSSDSPIISVVNGVLSEAIRRMASDIHVEPYEKRFRVRMRVDGALSEVTQIPMEMQRAVIARIKILSRMDIAESRVPQDGRIKLRSRGTEIDFRVNSMPTLFGEKIVLRMLSKGNLQLDLTKMGFEAKQLEIFKKGIYAANGLVLVTGPTGSGKTTTLYSALTELNQVSENLSTAEDPVEYNLEGINQVQVHKESGLTFASVLRALLRQDPDVILVGEIRDKETAEIAVQAALTGHLVLSTLHTNDASSTITRLINMGLEPFLVVDSLNVILAQRLLRTICVNCKVDQTYPKEKIIQLGVSPEEAARLKFFKGAGCSKCNNTGYKGRIAIYEILDFSTNLKQMVLRGESNISIKKQAVKEGMRTLRVSALARAIEGRTTLDEALSSTMED